MICISVIIIMILIIIMIHATCYFMKHLKH